MGIFFALLSGASFALNNLMVKKGLGENKGGDNGYFLTVLLNVVILGVVLLVDIMVVGLPTEFSETAFIFFVLSGLLTTGVGRFTYFSSIFYIGPSRASAIKNASPIFSILFAVIVLSETVALGPASGILLILLGIILLGAISFIGIGNGEDRRIEWMGYLLGIVSAVSFGLGQGVRKEGLLLMNQAFLGAWIGAVASLIFVVTYEAVRGNLRTTIKHNFTIFNRYFLIAGILNSFGPLFFYLGASYTEVSYVSAVAAAEPLLTILMSSLFFKKIEMLNYKIWAAVFLVFLGTVVIVVT
jgi:drug/metabolite transporter (DMT)-like permease